MKQSIALGLTSLLLVGAVATGCQNVGAGVELVEEAREPIWALTRRDQRRCAWPACGGHYVAAVNASSTMCVGGQTSAECYVSRLDWSALGVDESRQMELEDAASQGRVMLRGELARADEGFTTFRVRDALVTVDGQTVTVEEQFYEVRFNGRICTTSPCLSFDATPVNSDTYERVAGVSWTSIPGSDEEYDAAQAALSGDGLVVSGTKHTEEYEDYKGESRSAVYLDATAALLALDHPGPSCPDAEDPSVHYVSHDLGECRAMLLRCAPDEDFFVGECGCGCVASH